MDNKHQEAPGLRHQVFASAIGSITATLTLNPIGVIKTRLQAGHGKFVEVVNNIIREAGLGGFWVGARLGILQSLPSTILYMTTYENMRDSLLPVLPDRYHHIGAGIAGGVARSIVVTALAPIELMRTMQLGGSAQSMAALSHSIYTSGGVSGFYRGWSSTIMRDAPFSVIYWMCFERFKSFYDPLLGGYMRNQATPDEFSKLIVNFVSGSTSGSMAAVFTHPFDVLKTQRQLALTNLSSSVSSKNAVQPAIKICCLMSECCCPCTGPVAAATSVSSQQPPASASVGEGLRKIVHSRGIRGLFKGLSMRLATIVPGSGIMITTYEFAKTIPI